MEEPDGLQSMGSRRVDMTERLHFHFSLSSSGEGNGNPLQCSCLENLRDSGAWWAAVYGVAQDRTQLKWLRSIHLWSCLLAYQLQCHQNPKCLYNCKETQFGRVVTIIYCVHHTINFWTSILLVIINFFSYNCACNTYLPICICPKMQDFSCSFCLNKILYHS